MAAVKTAEEFEAQIRDLQQKRKNVSEVPAENRVGLGQEGHYDSDIYEGTVGVGRFEGYLPSIPATDDQEDEEEEHVPPVLGRKYTAPLNILNDLSKEERDFDPMAEHRAPRVGDRDDEYKARRRNIMISPERHDPFAGGKTPDISSERRTYADVMTENKLKATQKALTEQMKSKAKEGTLKTVNGTANSQPPAKRRRWDVASIGPADETPNKQSKSSWDAVEATTPSGSRWHDTPGRAKGADTPGATPGASTRQWDLTPGHASSGAATPGRETPGQQVTPSARRNRWDETPKTDRETPGHGGGWAETPHTDRTGADIITETPTPSASKRRTRWDETPGGATPADSTPAGSMTPSGMTPSGTPGFDAWWNNTRRFYTWWHDSWWIYTIWYNADRCKGYGNGNTHSRSLDDAGADAGMDSAA